MREEHLKKKWCLCPSDLSEVEDSESSCKCDDVATERNFWFENTGCECG